MRVVLEIVAGPHTGKKVELVGGQLVQIGRASWAEWSFPQDRSLAGLHFAVECSGDECLLRTLGRNAEVQLNGTSVKRSAIHDGDKIVAGDSTIAVRVEGGKAAPVPQPAVAPPPPDVAPPTVQRAPRRPAAEPAAASTAVPTMVKIPQHLLPLFRTKHQPLYAILDTARDERVLELLRACEDEHQSLYEGAKALELLEVAPYLVRLPPESKLLETLLDEGWGKSWGTYLTCDRPFAEVRKHLRHFLMVDLEGEGQVYFRFYDPRVLRSFLPTCGAQQANEFFGPVRTYLMEAKERGVLLRYSCRDEGVREELIPLFALEKSTS